MRVRDDDLVLWPALEPRIQLHERIWAQPVRSRQPNIVVSQHHAHHESVIGTVRSELPTAFDMLRCGYPTTVSVFVLLERRCLGLSDLGRFTTNTRDFYDCGQDYRRIGYAQHLSSISTLYRRLFDRTSVYIPNHSSASHSSQRGRKTRSTYICYRLVLCALPSLRVSAVCSIVIYWFQDRRDMKITGLGLAYQYFRYRNPLSGYTTSCFRCYYTRRM